MAILLLKKTGRVLLKGIISLVVITLLYLLFSLGLSRWTVNKSQSEIENPQTIYLSTNGIHLDIIIPKDKLPETFTKDLLSVPTDQYFSFGWGEKNFYLNVPEWKDLTAGVALKAMLFRSGTLIHLTRYPFTQSHWIAIEVSPNQLHSLIQYIEDTFSKNEQGEKIILPNEGYHYNDDFYEAEGSYSCFKTCNSWVNRAFKNSSLKACKWTPFDFSLMNKYR